MFFYLLFFAFKIYCTHQQETQQRVEGSELRGSLKVEPSPETSWGAEPISLSGQPKQAGCELNISALTLVQEVKDTNLIFLKKKQIKLFNSCAWQQAQRLNRLTKGS